MTFRDIEIKDRYITEKNDIPNEFYNIALPEAVLYKRAAGFFSSSALVSISKGLQSFYYNGGKIQLIVSPILSQDDCDAIENGYRAREDVIYESLVKNFNITEIENNDGCNFLAWLIYENRIDIKVLTRKDNQYGIFHDKFLILYDKDNNKISSRGSSNESRTAYEDNYETIEVDFSWDNSMNNRTQQRETQFDELWNGCSSQWVIDEFPSALKKKIIQVRKDIPKQRQQINSKNSNDKISHPENLAEKVISMPSYIDLREYQKKAITAWANHQCNGIYEMATGTGKTITAISSIVKLIEQYNKINATCGVVIVVPYKVLLEQWVDILSSFNFTPIPCYDSTKSWFDKVKSIIDLFNKGFRKNFCLITTNKTFAEPAFQSCINEITRDYVFCVDEMHHLATDKAIDVLPTNAKYKLGLSATLMTKYADEQMTKLKNYFGGVIYEFTMQEAIGKFLTPYYYHPIFVDLTDDELDQYLELSRKISKACAVNGGKIDENVTGLTALLSQRARLIASAENKLNKLVELKDIIKDTNYNLFYCGDKVEVDTNEKFINRVNNLLENEIGISIRKFTAEENKKEREGILTLFSNGIIQGLSAIRCLDEGVDIPQLKRAFILSSGTNPKEFIQRRGRILRKAPGKEFAEIYDFIVFPVLDRSRLQYLSVNDLQFERKVIAREYERLKEFAQLAINGTEAYDKFLKQWEIYSSGG